MSKMGQQNSDSSWDQVTVLRKHQPLNKTLKSDKDINAARRAGIDVETNKKFAAGGNRQHAGPSNAVKLDAETDAGHIAHVTMDVGRAIQTARQSKEWNQKELAQKINEQSSLVGDYEQGRAIPNQQVLAKMERVLGVKLRGKEIGQPFAKKGANAKKK